jgi:hypothetical protein
MAVLESREAARWLISKGTSLTCQLRIDCLKEGADAQANCKISAAAERFHTILANQ